MTYENDEGREESPADPVEAVGWAPCHVPDVGREPLDAVHPDDGHALEERDVHEGERRGVVVHDVEQVNATL